MWMSDPSPADRERADRALGSVLDVLTKSQATDEQLRTCLALLFVQVSDRLQRTPAVLRNAGAAATRLGIEPKDKPDAVAKKLESAAGTLPASLKKELERAMRELVVDDKAPSSKAAALVGAKNSKRPVGSEPAPAGSVKGGLGARLSNKKSRRK
jgi:hypothetical protein